MKFFNKAFFVFMRIVTFVVGTFVLFLAVGWFSEAENFWQYASAVLIGILGVYIMIAALIPHRDTVDTVAGEAIPFFPWDLPVKSLIRFISRIFDNL